MKQRTFLEDPIARSFQILKHKVKEILLKDLPKDAKNKIIKPKKEARHNVGQPIALTKSLQTPNNPSSWESYHGMFEESIEEENKDIFENRL